MSILPVLKPGDTVEIVAPASRCSDQRLVELQELLTSWQLKCHVSPNIFGDDLLCANSDDNRLQSLKTALLNPENTAIICARGGYGSMRLIPELIKINPPTLPKLFIGMSDITALNLFLQQQWLWPTVHGALSPDIFTSESIEKTRSILFGEVQTIEFRGDPINGAAKQNKTLTAAMTGGNLSLIQASIGTTWEIDAKNKILFLEDVGERGYRIDRMLEQLRQNQIFNQIEAIVFGDFIAGNEPNGSTLINPVLQRFANTCSFPIIKIAGVGHGHVNFPLPLGTQAEMQLGEHCKLICSR